MRLCVSVREFVRARHQRLSLNQQQELAHRVAASIRGNRKIRSGADAVPRLPAVCLLAEMPALAGAECDDAGGEDRAHPGLNLIRSGSGLQTEPATFLLTPEEPSI